MAWPDRSRGYRLQSRKSRHASFADIPDKFPYIDLLGRSFTLPQEWAKVEAMAHLRVCYSDPPG